MPSLKQDVILQIEGNLKAFLKRRAVPGRRQLKPEGVLLTTFPGITQIARDRWGEQWYWAFTHLSARGLFEERFPVSNVEVEAHGNVLTAISFLHGLAAEELREQELRRRTPGYEVVVTVRAVKRGVV